MPHLLCSVLALSTGHAFQAKRDGWINYSKHMEQRAPRTRNTEAGVAREKERSESF